ncbi:DNA-binding protein [Allostella sp. ATCC 35155]|nr:DNA-binding protein [Stella sp. ATCC 35155]
MKPPRPSEFPEYSAGERRADRWVHVLGIAGALAGAAVLLSSGGADRPRAVTASLAVYCTGLVLMLGASAAYNLTPPGRAKERLRRLDHAAIYAMIAGSYTPFLANLVAWPWGPILLAMVWAAAAIGILLKLAAPRRYERLGTALYLVQGWILLPAIGPIGAALPGLVLGLLLAGGAVYTLGVFVHSARRLRYHNAIWHGMVLAAAALHFGAVAVAFAGRIS